MNDKIERKWTAEELYEILEMRSRSGQEHELATFLAKCTRLWAVVEEATKNTTQSLPSLPVAEAYRRGYLDAYVNALQAVGEGVEK